MFFNRIRNVIEFFRQKQKSKRTFRKGIKRELEEVVGYNIVNEKYYLKALTHRSYVDISNDIKKSNERLEFLGDSVLSVIVSNYLFNYFTKEDEGFLTKTRSHLVNSKALARASASMNLVHFLFIDKRFKRSSGDGIQKISADALEALIGAIFLDKGLRYARRFVEKWIIIPNLKSGRYQIDKNFKGQLLELTHSLKVSAPEYIVVNENGPEHNKKFGIEVIIDEEVFGYGEGKSKKAAEQAAAKEAFQKLNTE